MLDGDIGPGVHKPFLPPEDMPIPREVTSMSDGQRWHVLREIASDLHRVAALCDGNPRIGHLVLPLHEAVSGCNNAHSLSGETLVSALTDVMKGFLLVCDTFPVYNEDDGKAWARAIEKKRFAAAFLQMECPLWLPDGFTLGKVDGSD